MGFQIGGSETDLILLVINALEGATPRQDLDDNATLCGKKAAEPGDCDTAMGAPKAAAEPINQLNMYSARERTSTSTGSSL